MRNGPYNLIIAPEDYPGKKYRGRYAYEHTVVFWKANGKVPLKGFEIHHINHDHRDNRIENLKLVTNKEHRKIHTSIQSEKAKIEINCGWCNAKLTMRKRDLNMKMKANRYGKAFCNRICGAKHHHSSVP